MGILLRERFLKTALTGADDYWMCFPFSAKSAFPRDLNYVTADGVLRFPPRDIQDVGFPITRFHNFPPCFLLDQVQPSEPQIKLSHVRKDWFSKPECLVSPNPR